MKKIKIFLEAVVVISVVLALILPTSAVITNDNENEIPELKEIEKNLKKGESIKRQTGLQENVLISPEGEGDFIHPQITKDNNGNIVVAMTQQLSILDKRLAWSYTTDGETWVPILSTEAALDVYNDVAMIDFEYYTGLLGVFNDIEDGFESFYTIGDITDLATWEFMYWTGGAEDLEYTIISDNGYLEGQYHEMDGPVYMTIQHLIYDVYDIPKCPNQMIIGFDETGTITGGESTFDGQNGPGGTNPFATAPAVDPDASNEYMKSHYAWQFNDPEGASKIVWKKIEVVEGDTDSTDIEFTPYQQYVGEGEHPAIAHYSQNVAVVYMSGGNVVCAYSSDDGENWETTTIGSGGYPDITAVGSTFKCAYVEGGNLFVVESEDGGANWGEPVQVNDEEGSVIAEENTADIHSAGVVWTDNRNGDKDIYYAAGAAAAQIIVESVSGGVGVTATIKNIGSAAATDVAWSIDITGNLVFLGQSAEGVIPNLEPDQSVQVSSGFPLGFGGIEINVAANGATETKTGTLLLFFITGLE